MARVGHHLPDGQQQGEAQALATACLYPPAGKRKQRSDPCGDTAGEQLPEDRQRRSAGDPVIETRKASTRSDEILSVPGISGIYRPSDMGLSLGLIPTLDRRNH